MKKFQTSHGRLHLCKNFVCFLNSPPPGVAPPQAEWHDGHRQINEAGKCIRENTALRKKFGRLGVITTQASLLAQVGDGVLIGQRSCWLMT